MQAIISSLDQVAEALRPEYTEREDGKFVLKVDGEHPATATAISTANTRIQELTGKVDEFRGTNTRLLKGVGADNIEAAIARLDALSGIDPAEVAELKAKVASLKEKGVTKPEDFAAIVAREVQKVSETLNKRIDASENKAKEADQALATEKLRGTLTQAGIKAGVADSALDDFLARGMATFKVIDGQVTAVREDGGPRFSEKTAGQPLSPEEYAAGLQKTAGHLFKSTDGSDAQGSQGGNQPFVGGKVITEAEFGDNIDDIVAGKVTVPVPWGSD